MEKENHDHDQLYDEAEAEVRFEAALRGALKTPATPLKGKPKSSRLARTPAKKPTRKSR